MEERGVDPSGSPVLVRPPAGEDTGVAFIEQEELERVAQIAASLQSPWVLPVLCASPRLVYAAPPPATRPDIRLPLREAATCLLQFCDVVARVHAGGWGGFCTDVHSLRVSRDSDGWRVTVVLPNLPPRGASPSAPDWACTAVRHDLQAAVGFFRDLLVGRSPRPEHRFFILGESWGKAPALPRFEDDAAHALLARLLRSEASEDLSPDVASLAEQVLPLAIDREGWAARVAALPRVRAISQRRDWDRMIELGEAERAASANPGDRPLVDRPLAEALAAAWHQRACLAHARRDFTAALRDVDRAIVLDPWTRYLVTRGVVREALGDPAGARADYDRAVTGARSDEPPTAPRDPIEAWQDDETGAFEGARALYARGVARLEAGDVVGATADLEEGLAITGALREPGDDERRPTLEHLDGIVQRALRTARARATSGAERTRSAPGR